MEKVFCVTKTKRRYCCRRQTIDVRNKIDMNVNEIKGKELIDSIKTFQYKLSFNERKCNTNFLTAHFRICSSFFFKFSFEDLICRIKEKYRHQHFSSLSWKTQGCACIITWKVKFLTELTQNNLKDQSQITKNHIDIKINDINTITANKVSHTLTY